MVCLASALATVGGTVAVAKTATKVIGLAGLIVDILLFASNNRPGDNRKQNKQFQDAMKKLGVESKDDMRRVHNKIRGQNFGYNELIDFIKKVLNLK